MVVAIGFLIVSSFSSAVSAVVSPGQLLRRGAAVYGQTIRLQGKVVGGASYNPSSLAHLFRVSDGHVYVLVSYGSDLPGGFKTGASVEAQGTFNGHLFAATMLTAKCPTKYQAASASG
jgi:cytochrome c-type biogenesis protein CcmE